jgi:hypothetical protein
MQASLQPYMFLARGFAGDYPEIVFITEAFYLY